ncbi:hypothetical protein CspeluHIS016_0211080 [Cutaneotrichosporon spelunceum]|uniref:Acetyl-CoA synthetase-like protein n=1 Tax=Cutaneotrichosporon spelunceum TaxID=1672016 RepID=A0AAD3TT67_9TREE|nr:hypothetical protein CspeluHIS016_0211080 [Cutaneotrichosporon spelunceum]
MTAKLSIQECDKLLTQPGSPYEMVEDVVEGRKYLVWKHTPPTFRELIMDKFQQWATREAVSDPVPEPAGYYARRHTTYGEMYGLALQLGAWLRERGVQQGERVGLGGLNSLGFIVAYCGIHLIGAVPVMLNATLTADTQLHCLGLTKPKLTLVDQHSGVIIGPLAAQLQALGVGPTYCYDKIGHLPANVRAGLVELTAVASPGSVLSVQAGHGLDGLGPDSDGAIFFTSGTTSKPKGVICTQRQCLHHVVASSIPAARAVLRAGGTVEEAFSVHTPPPEPGVMLIAVPLFHVTGCLGWMMRAWFLGFKVVFMRRWNVDDAVKLCIDERVNLIGGVPAIATAIIQSPKLPPDHVFDGLTYGGAPPPQRLASDIAARWPAASATHAYGMTETNGLQVALTGADYHERPESVGLSIPTSSMRVVDEHGHPLPPNTMGLLQCSGPNIMKCYVDNPAATAEALTPDGWLNTGDMALICPEGFLYIRDRAKDVIIRGGENIASAEVENEVFKDDRIAECAAVPVPDDRLGELVGVAVSLAPGASATPESVLAAAAPRLRHPARPVVCVIMDALPRNPNGKMVKSDIKKIVADRYEAAKRGSGGLVKAKL